MRREDNPEAMIEGSREDKEILDIGIAITRRAEIVETMTRIVIEESIATEMGLGTIGIEEKTVTAGIIEKDSAKDSLNEVTTATTTITKSETQKVTLLLLTPMWPATVPTVLS